MRPEIQAVYATIHAYLSMYEYSRSKKVNAGGGGRVRLCTLITPKITEIIIEKERQQTADK